MGLENRLVVVNLIFEASNMSNIATEGDIRIFDGATSLGAAGRLFGMLWVSTMSSLSYV